MKNNKKLIFAIPASLTAIVMAGSMAVTTFAASNPSDDASSYSYNTGRNSAYEIQAENGYNEDDEITNPDYSFNTGRTSNAARHGAFVNMPTQDDLSDEELAAFFEGNGLGEGAAFEDGEYKEELKNAYGYYTGRNAYAERHAE